MAETVHMFSSLGVGGVLAGIMFYFYRRDRKDSGERFATLTKDYGDRYEKLAQDFRTIVQDNTAALTRVVEAIENNGKRSG